MTVFWVGEKLRRGGEPLPVWVPTSNHNKRMTNRI